MDNVIYTSICFLKKNVCSKEYSSTTKAILSFREKKFKIVNKKSNDLRSKNT